MAFLEPFEVADVHQRFFRFSPNGLYTGKVKMYNCVFANITAYQLIY